jgi:hypothetical protein
LTIDENQDIIYQLSVNAVDLTMLINIALAFDYVMLKRLYSCPWRVIGI